MSNAEKGGLMTPERKDEPLAERPGELAKEQARKKASFAREQAIEETERVDKAKRAVKNAPAEAERLTKEQARKKAFIANEQAIEETERVDKAKRAAKSAPAEAERLAKEQTRKKAFIANEQAIADAYDARRLKAENQSPE
jgi:hypothetical protein